MTSAQRYCRLAGLWGLLAGVVLLVGCAKNVAWQQQAPLARVCTEQIDCSGRYYRRYQNHDLAFAEFTERGHAFDTARLDDVLERIRDHAVRDDGVITIVFIHGWLNNAEERNANLLQFRKVLDTVAAYNARTFNKHRRVVGLYVGWRGVSLDLPLLKFLSFWNRKSVAENLGSGAVTQLLLKLDAIHRIGEERPARQQNVMVTVGHSFGGAILLTAIKDVMVDRLIDPVANVHAITEVTGIGDELFLLNPAIEVSQALSIVDTAVERDYTRTQPPLLTIISSDADAATHMAFPAGQAFGTIARWKQVDIQRKWYRHRELDIPVPLREENLDVITVGNFAPFLTHRLEIVADVEHLPERCSRFRVSSCQREPGLCRARGWSKTAAHKSVMPLPAGYPLRFIKTGKGVIAGHSDIFSKNVRRLVSRLITDQLVGNHWNDSTASRLIDACG